MSDGPRPGAPVGADEHPETSRPSGNGPRPRRCGHRPEDRRRTLRRSARRLSQTVAVEGGDAVEASPIGRLVKERRTPALGGVRLGRGRDTSGDALATHLKRDTERAEQSCSRPTLPPSRSGPRHARRSCRSSPRPRLGDAVQPSTLSPKTVDAPERLACSRWARTQRSTRSTPASASNTAAAVSGTTKPGKRRRLSPGESSSTTSRCWLAAARMPRMVGPVGEPTSSRPVRRRRDSPCACSSAAQ